MSEKLFGNDRNVAILFVGGGDNFPIYFWSIGGNASVNFAIEVFDDLRTALGPPCLRRFHFLPVVQKQGIWQREGRDFGVIVICRVGRVRVAVHTAPQGRNVEKTHRSLVVLLGGEVNGRRRA